jgi:hypothetical protein
MTTIEELKVWLEKRETQMAACFNETDKNDLNRLVFVTKGQTYCELLVKIEELEAAEKK